MFLPKNSIFKIIHEILKIPFRGHVIVRIAPTNPQICVVVKTSIIKVNLQPYKFLDIIFLRCIFFLPYMGKIFLIENKSKYLAENSRCCHCF